MNWFDRYLKALWEGYGLVGIVIVVVLLLGVLTWAKWMELDLGVLLRLVIGA